MDSLTSLNTPIKKLLLSEEFKNMAEINGFETMKEILSFTGASFLGKQGVNYHLYKELADYLKENELLHLFKHE